MTIILPKTFKTGSRDREPVAVFATLLKDVFGSKVAKNSLLKLYNNCNYNYHTGKAQSILTDDQFDKLRAILLEHKLIKPTVGAVYAKSEEIDLPHRMPSLEFVRSREEMAKWANKNGISGVLITPKYDGISLYLRYYKGKFKFAATRGDGYRGKDVTRHALLAPCIPKRLKEPISCELRCEIYLPESVFQSKFSVKVGGPFVNARNAVAGTFGRNKPNEKVLKYLDCRVFEVFSGPHTQSGVALKTTMLNHMRKYGLPITDGFYDTLDRANLPDILEKWSAKYDVLMDGLVCECDIYAQRNSIKPEIDGNPGYARAYKPIGMDVLAEVINVEWSMSKDGMLKPVILIKKV